MLFVFLGTEVFIKVTSECVQVKEEFFYALHVKKTHKVVGVISIPKPSVTGYLLKNIRYDSTTSESYRCQVLLTQ